MRLATRSVWGVVALCLTTLSAVSAAQEPLKRLTIEELLEVDVTSVSRRPERVGAAAAAVQVISGHDLRRSGAPNLPEALRLAIGVTVARQNNAGYAISTRGFTSAAGNKLLVLIDGRSIYTPLFSGVFWDVQDVLLQDVARIEIIRGPGAALWGSNAVNGVINIITMSASNTQGGVVGLAVGNEERAIASARYGGRVGRADYRVFSKYTYRDGQVLRGRAIDDAQRRGLGGFRVDWDLGRDRSLSVLGEGYSGRFGLTDRPPVEAWGAHLLARWRQRVGSRSDLQVQAYYDRASRLVPRQLDEDRGTWDLDVQHHVRAGERHDLLWGGGYRYTRDETRDVGSFLFEPPAEDSALVSAFAQDEWTVRPNRLWLIGGARFEHNPYTGLEVQPTLRVRLAPVPRQTLWAAVSRAVRLPTRLDLDMRFVGPGTVPLISGSRAFEAEKALTVEAGYRVRPHASVSIDLAAFATRYRDLRSQERLGPGPLPTVLANGLRGRTAGFEITTEYQPGPFAKLRGAYAFLHKRLDLEPWSTDVTGGAAEGNDPRHQGLVGWSFDIVSGVTLDGQVRLVGALPQPAVPAYAEADFRLGWRVNRRLGLSLSGRDLLHDSHVEFGAPSVRESFERSVYLRADVEF